MKYAYSLLCTLAAGFVGLISSASMAEIYLCTDAATGKKVYQNYGSSKGCKRLDIDSSPSIPAPNLPYNTNNANNNGKETSRPNYNNAPANTSPKDFPSVNAGQQYNRDQERRRIIEDELRNEERRLAELRKEYNGGEPERTGGERNYAKYQDRAQRMSDEIKRSEANVEALKRELGTIRY